MCVKKFSGLTLLLSRSCEQKGYWYHAVTETTEKLTNVPSGVTA